MCKTYVCTALGSAFQADSFGCAENLVTFKAVGSVVVSTG